MEALLRLEMAPHVEMRASAELVASMQLLALGRHDLEAVIAEELATNPALEGVTSTTAAASYGCGPCSTWSQLGTKRGTPASSAAREADWDSLAVLGGNLSPPEELLRDVMTLLEESERPIAVFVVGSLDEHGFLCDEADAIARTLRVETDSVLRVIEAVRQVGPPGIGASNVRHSLMLQLEALDHNDPSIPVARTLVRDHLDDLAAGRFGSIAARLNVPVAAVLAGRDFIRRRLRPYPAVDFVTRDTPLSASERPLSADLIVSPPTRGRDVLEVEVLEPRWVQLRLNRYYERLLSDGQAVDRHEGDESSKLLAPEDRLHVQNYVTRARLFLQRLHQRWTTLQKIGDYVVNYQRAFVLSGPAYLEPLTLAAVAAVVGCHESTVSRATSNKAIALPTGQVVPLRRFFQSSRRPRELIRQLIASEGTPLTDAAIARALAEQGTYVARRTVAKYRNELGIPACQRRARPIS